MKGYLPVIIGMALVTYLPRVIPLMALKDRKIEWKSKEVLTVYTLYFLKCIDNKGYTDVIPGYDSSNHIRNIFSCRCSILKGKSVVISICRDISILYISLQ